MEEAPYVPRETGLIEGYHINKPPPSASTYSIPRRTLYILKRATAKFPGDLAVWLAYVEYAAREGMTKVVAKGLNSALQHHPLSPTLYLLLSYHHLHPGAPLPRSSIPSTSQLDLPSARDDEPATSAFALEGTQPARTTLLLGLRVLPASHTLWREYVKLELGWVEALRRRWHVLGINMENKSTDKEFDGDAAALAGGDGAFGEEGEEARRAILSGQLVIHAIQEALGKVSPTGREIENGEVLDGMDFRTGLIAMLRSYPSPLRTKALGVVYEDLEKVAAAGGMAGAQARLSLVTRPLYDREYEAGEKPTAGVVLNGVALVEALGGIGKEIRSTAKKAGPEFVEVAGIWLADQTRAAENPDLQRYLFSTLKVLTKESLSPPASVLVRHLDLVRDLDNDAFLSTARSHVAQHPSNAALQLALVSAVVESSDVASVRSACADAAAKVTIRNLTTEEQEDVVELWKTWAAWEETHGDASEWKKLLRDSLRLGASIPALHSTLLASYYAAQLPAGTTPQKALDAVVRSYQPTSVFFTLAFEILATESNGSQAHLAKLYDAWRAACRAPSERVDAALTWSEWLMGHGKGRDAYDVTDVVRREVRSNESETARLEAGWKGLLDASERNGVDEAMSEDESDSGSGSEGEDEEGESEGESEGSEDDDMSADLDIAF